MEGGRVHLELQVTCDTSSGSIVPFSLYLCAADTWQDRWHAYPDFFHNESVSVLCRPLSGDAN